MDSLHRLVFFHGRVFESGLETGLVVFDLIVAANFLGRTARAAAQRWMVQNPCFSPRIFFHHADVFPSSRVGREFGNCTTCFGPLRHVDAGGFLPG